MLRISIIACALAIAIVALIPFSGRPEQSNSVTIKSYGQIVYPQTTSIQPEPPSSSFSWYPAIKDLISFAFGAISAIGGVIKILEYKKNRGAQKLKICNVDRVD